MNMIRYLTPVLATLLLAGCAYQTEAQINAELSRHVGQPETDLVRQLGVPTRSFESGGHRFLAYYSGEQQIIPPAGGGFGWGGYGGYGGYGGWGGWHGGGWGGWGWGGADWGPSDIVSYGCETTYEVGGGHVLGFTRHGNAC